MAELKCHPTGRDVWRKIRSWIEGNFRLATFRNRLTWLERNTETRVNSPYPTDPC